MLDLIGLALIMKTVLNFQGEQNGSKAPALSSNLLVEKLSSGVGPSMVLLVVVGIFLAKGVLSMILQMAVVRTLALEAMNLVKKLTNLIFWNRTSRYRDLTVQDISFAIYNSSEIVFKDTLAPVSIIIADSVLLLAISANLLFSAKVLFFPTVIYFIVIFAIMRKIEKKGTRTAYNIQWTSEVKTRALIAETSTSLRELYASSKLDSMVNKIVKARDQGVGAGSVISIAQLRPKYVYDMALFGGIGVIALVSVISGRQDSILTYLTLFVISSSRMIPSLLRIQFYLGVFQKAGEQTRKVFEVLDLEKDISADNNLNIQENLKALQSFKFIPEIKMRDVNFSYTDSEPNSFIHDLNLDIHPGETIAIVGPSGAGKSTLVDLILGYQIPKSGSIKISSLEPRECFHIWPGKVAYVPQKVSIYEGSLFENVAIGVDAEMDLDAREKVSELLRKVGLGTFLSELPEGLDSFVSEMGTSLSGGQVQRIGIARALFSDPSIMVFDESTSALDSLSENSIMELLLGFKGYKTLIFIAHRLSTVKLADRIIYIQNGRIIAEGDFTNLRRKVPEFNLQVEALDISDADD